jgi:hypothetical protein
MNFKLLCDEMRAAVLKSSPWAKPEKKTSYECQMMPKASVPNHLLWMLDTIPTLPEEKANRWLGFAQGWMCAYYVWSIDQCRDAVTRAKDSPSVAHTPDPDNESEPSVGDAQPGANSINYRPDGWL